MSDPLTIYHAASQRYRLGAIDEASLTDMVRPYSKILIVVDMHTEVHCYPLIEASFHEMPSTVHTVPAGESAKSLTQLERLWQAMHDHALDRHSLLIGLGGGVVGDLAGVAAATYMRGIDYLALPTTLLAQVDASIGGKNGINFQGLKNILGTIRPARAVWADPRFLATLSDHELRVGHVEMLKHGLLQGETLWSYLLDHARGGTLTHPDCIWRCAKMKMDVVGRDLYESGLRKQLNLGHTVGHALESITLMKGEPITHGAAVAYGMLVMADLSVRHTALSDADHERVVQAFHGYVDYWPTADEVDTMLYFMKNDKKNKDGRLRFVLMRRIGDICIDQQVSPDEVHAACHRVDAQYGPA